jgi:hypothetical protein
MAPKYFQALQLISNALSTIKETLIPPSGGIANNYNTIINQQLSIIDPSLQTIDPDAIASIGSFYFDGAQSDPYVRYDLTGSTITNSNLEQFANVADLYRATNTSFSYQDIDYGGLKLTIVFSKSRGADFAPEAILAPKSGLPPSCEITFPQQFLPSYSFNTASQPFENAAFYSDSRRSYLIVSSETDFKQVVVRNPTLAAPPSYIAVGSVFFFNHYHPWVGELIKRLNWAERGISYLLDPATQGLNAASLPTGQGKFEF